MTPAYSSCSMADSEAGIFSSKVNVTRCVFSSNDISLAFNAVMDQLHNIERVRDSLYTWPG